MKNYILTLIIISFFLSCKEESKAPVLDIQEEIKEVSKEGVTSNIKELNKSERVEELAEMLGGKELTASALAHAKELLSI